MGLLEDWNAGIDAANQEQSFTPVQQAMMQAGMGMMSGWGQVSDKPMANNWIGQGIQGGMQGYMQGQAQLKADRLEKTAQMLKQLQMQQLLRQYQQQQRDEEAQKAFGAGAGANYAADVGPAQGMKFSPQAAMAFGASPGFIKNYMELTTPKREKIGADETLVQETPEGKFEPIATGKPKLPEGMRLNAVGEPEFIPAWEHFQLSKAEKGATKVSQHVQTSTDKETASKLVTDLLDKKRPAAESSAKILSTVNRMTDQDIDKAFTGPGASLKLTVAQLAGTNPDSVRSTRIVLQGLAKMDLAAKRQMAGLGAMSESEGKAVAKADAGDIDSMTGEEIKIVKRVAEEIARSDLDAYEKTRSVLESNTKDPTAKALVSSAKVSAPKAQDRAWPTPNAQAIQKLKLKQGTIEQFESYFGPGSASKVLGQ